MTFDPNTATCSELVRRARNLNQQAVGYKLAGQMGRAAQMFSRRQLFMHIARSKH